MTSGMAPNSLNIQRVAAGVANQTSIVVHPEYMYWRTDWRKIRDCIAGQREIKRKFEIYLKRMPGQDQHAYERYVERAVFYNMTAQTHTGMLGQVFRRDPVIKDLPGKFKDAVVSGFGKDGSGHIAFSKGVMGEILSMGRYGVLVDVDPTPSLTPLSYAVGYTAENILDWTVENINGQFKITRVLLREFIRELRNTPNQQNPWIGQAEPSSKDGMYGTDLVQNAAQYTTKGGGAASFVRQTAKYLEAYTYKTVYRELLLVPQPDGTFVYEQNVYVDDPQVVPRENFAPTVRGKKLDFIPFMFFGATGNNADVEKPPLLDIADLNLSHYRTYADLEHGRVYTALPVYYAPTRDDEGAGEYHIGPDMVWEVPADTDPPGIVEYKGTGLKALETALDQKQRQIEAIGGRLMPGQKTSESPGQTNLREATEQALVLNAILSTEAGMREVVRWWLMWRDVPLPQSDTIRYQLNRIFLSAPVGARELRAVHMMYTDGILPVNVLYDYFLKAEVIDPSMSEEDFTTALKDPDSFINMPDIAARQRGYQSRQQELDQVSVAREADMQQQEIDLQERQVELEEQAPPPVVKPPQAKAQNPSNPAGPSPPRPGRSGTSSTKKPSKPKGGGMGGGSV